MLLDGLSHRCSSIGFVVNGARVRVLENARCSGGFTPRNRFQENVRIFDGHA
jgi:hypothetical protein